MIHRSRLRKIIIGSAFLGAFLLAPQAGAQEVDPLGALDQFRADAAAFGVEVPPAPPALADALTGAADQVNGALAQAAVVQEPAAVDYAEPLTNPEPLGLAKLQEATQPEFKPQNTDPNYMFKNDAVSKVLAAKPTADFVLHRVPGSFFDAPAAPEESHQAMTRGHSLYGPGTPIYVGQQNMCTLTAAGHDAAGRKVGLTAGHCGQVGEQVSSADSWQVGPTGTIVAKGQALDYSVIEFNDRAEVTSEYNGVKSYGVGGRIEQGEVTCKRGVATGTTCGMVLLDNNVTQLSQVCAMEGDSGAPLFKRGRVVAMITGGVGSAPCRTPLQGALHSPATATRLDAVVADLNRRGGPGSGFVSA